MIFTEFVQWFFSQDSTILFPFVVISALCIVVGLLRFTRRT